MKATILLADSAQAVEGKLYILGGGWTVTGPSPTPFAIAVIIEVPWDQTNRPHVFRLDLLDEDGRPVTFEGWGPGGVVTAGGEFELGRPPGMKAGTPLTFPLAINFPPIPLEPGARYTWTLSVDDESREDWQVFFDVRRGE